MPRPSLFMFLALLGLAGCEAPTTAAPAADPVFTPRVLNRVPHDPTAFTQGLLIDGDVWIESTGLYGQSDLREVDRATGEVTRRVPLPRRYFGEGVALLHGKLYQLTWRERTGFIWDRETFEEVGRFSYRGEGWGLATDGTHLFLSDGSSWIRVYDPENFARVRRFQVVGARGPVEKLNELAWIDGEIWANVFETNWIVRFDPAGGRVLGFIDLHHLPPEEDVHPGQDVLNGIAHDPKDGSVWVTGKNWKALYQIERP